LFANPETGSKLRLHCTVIIGCRNARNSSPLIRIDVGGFLLECGKWRHFQADRHGQGLLGFAFMGFFGQTMTGLTFLVCVPSYRRDFLDLFKQSKVGAVVLIALSKTLFSVSEAITLYATLLAPVALVLLVNSFQSLFVFAFGILLTLFFPRVAEESLGRMKMLQKGVGICLMLVGGYLIR
jgi:hypothetical protein